MRKLNFYCREGKLGSTYTITVDLGENYENQSVLKHKDMFIKNIQKAHPKATLIELLVPTKAKIAKPKLMEIGQDVASGWGAVCENVITYENLVCFKCNEYGEKFNTYLTYDEIAAKYN